MKVLKRDKCEECIKLKKVSEEAGTKRMFCSQAHAHEEYTLMREEYRANLQKEIFDKIAECVAKGSMDTADNGWFKEKLNELQDFYY